MKRADLTNLLVRYITQGRVEEALESARSLALVSGLAIGPVVVI